jgi:hypothetical protein
MKRSFVAIVLVSFFFALQLAASQYALDWSSAKAETGQFISFSILLPRSSDRSEVRVTMRQTNQDWEIVEGGQAGIRNDTQGIHGTLQCFAITNSFFPGLILSWREAGLAKSLVFPPAWFFVSAPLTDLTAQPPVRGLRGPIKAPFPWLVIAAVVILVALLVTTFIVFRKRKKGLQLPGKEDIPDPWELACKRLEILKRNLPIDDQGIKEHIFLLNETLKQYLGGRTGLPLVEQTSAGVVEACFELGWTGDREADELKDWLLRGDMAKFARQIPSLNGLTEYATCLEVWLERAESGWRKKLHNEEVGA